MISETKRGDEPTDEALALGAAQGDLAALEGLLTRLRGTIYNLALRMVHDPGDAEDVTQEVLVKIAGAIRSFEGRSRLRTWVYRITANHVANLRRRPAELEAGSFADFGAALDGMPDAEPPDPAPGVDAGLLLREVELSCTRGMLLCLSREQRLAFVLGTVLGVDSPVGGEAMEITAEHFRQLLSRARRDLFAFMHGQCGLVNRSNPCRCARKTRAFIEAGVVDPGRMQFEGESLERVEEEIPAIVDVVDELERSYARLFREQPFAAPKRADTVREAIRTARQAGLL